jgi:hypothetical protein
MFMLETRIQPLRVESTGRSRQTHPYDVETDRKPKSLFMWKVSSRSYSILEKERSLETAIPRSQC